MVRGSIVSTVFAAAVVSTALSTSVTERNLDVRASDGALLKATYFSPGLPGPSILLLHQCSRDRHAWDHFARRLAAAGIHVLAFDYRGFGETAGTLPPPPFAPAADAKSPFGPTLSGSWLANKDVEAAYVFLRALPGVDRNRIAVGGASCGAGFAADLAIRHPEIRALFLMSGHISGGAAAHIAATPWLSVFGVAEGGDMPTTYEGVRTAIAASRNSTSTMKLYAGHKHGVEMFLDNPELEGLITHWLHGVLR